MEKLQIILSWCEIFLTRKNDFTASSKTKQKKSIQCLFMNEF